MTAVQSPGFPPAAVVAAGGDGLLPAVYGPAVAGPLRVLCRQQVCGDWSDANARKPALTADIATVLIIFLVWKKKKKILTSARHQMTCLFG